MPDVHDVQRALFAADVREMSDRTFIDAETLFKMLEQCQWDLHRLNARVHQLQQDVYKLIVKELEEKMMMGTSFKELVNDEASMRVRILGNYSGNMLRTSRGIINTDIS
jgi:hypothetical protein